MNEEWTLPSLPKEEDADANVESNIAVPGDKRDLLQDLGVPYARFAKEPEPQSGKLMSLLHDVADATIIYPAARMIGTNLYKATLPENKAVDPPGWRPTAADIEGYPEDNATRNYLLESPNSAELASRQQEIREQASIENYYGNGIPVVTPLIKLASMYYDPTNKFLPGFAATRFSSFTKDILMNTTKASGAIILNAGIVNAIHQAEIAGGNVEDTIFNTARDAIYMTAIHTGLRSASVAADSARLWKFRTSATMERDGFTTEPEVNAKGEVTGFKVVPNDLFTEIHGIHEDDFVIKAQASPETTGTTKSPEQINKENVLSLQKAYQDDLNYEMSETGLFGAFLGDKRIGKAVKSAAVWWSGSPYLKAMNSKSPTIRNFMSRLGDNSIVTKAETKGIPVPDSAETISSYYSDLGHVEAINQRKFFLQELGLFDGANVAEAKFKMGSYEPKLFEGKPLTEEIFGREVTSALNDKRYRSPLGRANEAANSMRKNVYEPIERALLDHGVIDTEFKTPINARNYTTSMYSQEQVITRPDEFYDFVVRKEREADIAVENINKTFEAYDKNLETLNKQLEIAIKKKTLKNKAEIESRINFVTEKRNQYAKSLNDNIASDDPTLSRLVDEEATLLYREELNRKIKELEETNARLESEGKPKIKSEAERLVKEPIFQKPFKSDKERLEYAYQLRQTITNTSHEDIQMQAFGISPGNPENVNVFKKRRVRILQEDINQAGFLETDMSRIATAYTQATGKVLGLAAAFPEYHPRELKAQIAAKLQLEHQQREIDIGKITDAKKRSKALLKNNERLAKDIKNINQAYAVYTGTYNATANRSVLDGIAVVRNLATITKSGLFPVTSSSDFSAGLLKQRTLPALANVLRPLIRSIPNPKNKLEKEAIRNSAADAALGLSVERSARALRMNNSGADFLTSGNPMLARMRKATSAMAEYTHTATGFNAINDMNERQHMVAMQSNFLRLSKRYLAGDLEPTPGNMFELRMLARYGVDIKADAKIFVEQYEASGGWEDNGAFYSNVHQWTDYRAAYRFNIATRRAVTDGLAKNTLFTSPYWTHDPIFNLTTQFSTWSYEMFPRFVISSMQTPSKEKAIGLLSMIGSSMLIEPLLNLAKGKPAYENDETWFDAVVKGLLSSGILGPNLRWLQIANGALGGGYLPVTSKYKDRGFESLLGPGIGAVGDIARGIGAAGRGDTTDTQARKDFKSIPFISSWYMAPILNGFVDYLEYPKTKKEATPWAYRDLLSGE